LHSCYYYKGHTDANVYAIRWPDGFRHEEDGRGQPCDWPYRVVVTVERELAIVTYCEGDLQAEKFLDGDGYRAGLKRMRDFYIASASYKPLIPIPAAEEDAADWARRAISAVKQLDCKEYQYYQGVVRYRLGYSSPLRSAGSWPELVEGLMAAIVAGELRVR
jgi:hypothetical protein